MNCVSLKKIVLFVAWRFASRDREAVQVLLLLIWDPFDSSVGILHRSIIFFFVKDNV
jgi:hypothetical protein